MVFNYITIQYLFNKYMFVLLKIKLFFSSLFLSLIVFYNHLTDISILMKGVIFLLLVILGGILVILFYLVLKYGIIPLSHFIIVEFIEFFALLFTVAVSVTIVYYGILLCVILLGFYLVYVLCYCPICFILNFLLKFWSIDFELYAFSGTLEGTLCFFFEQMFRLFYMFRYIVRDFQNTFYCCFEGTLWFVFEQIFLLFYLFRYIYRYIVERTSSFFNSGCKLIQNLFQFSNLVLIVLLTLLLLWFRLIVELVVWS